MGTTFSLASKTRVESRVKRIYDEPQTPYKRVMKEEDVSLEVKERLQKIYEGLNPAELRRRILKLQERLLALATPVRRRVGHEK